MALKHARAALEKEKPGNRSQRFRAVINIGYTRYPTWMHAL
jgi:hypothetical protein